MRKLGAATNLALAFFGLSVLWMWDHEGLTVADQLRQSALSPCE